MARLMDALWKPVSTARAWLVISLARYFSSKSGGILFIRLIRADCNLFCCNLWYMSWFGSRAVTQSLKKVIWLERRPEHLFSFFVYKKPIYVAAVAAFLH